MFLRRNGGMRRLACAAGTGSLICALALSCTAAAQDPAPDQDSSAAQPTVHVGRGGTTPPCPTNYRGDIIGERPSGIEQRLHNLKSGDDTHIFSNADACELYIEPASPLSTPRLFVFIPGTSMVPAQYQKILVTAGQNRYYAVSLSYPNTKSEGDECVVSIGDCTERTRENIVFGKNPAETNSDDTINSIVHRLIDFLKDRAAHGGQWASSFLDNGRIRWDHIVIAGHSQGSGDAAIIARKFTTYRMVLFSGISDRTVGFQAAVVRNSKPAPWLDNSSDNSYATSKDNMYAFIHFDDTFVNRFTGSGADPADRHQGDQEYIDNKHEAYQSWRALGIPAGNFLTAYTDVSNPPDPKKNCSKEGLCEHESTVADDYTPDGPNDGPLYAPVWVRIAFSDN